jgi:hypothetical protein
VRTAPTSTPGKKRSKLDPISDEAWELVRKGVITEHGFKIGRRPGFILIMEGDTEEAVRATIKNFPLAGESWFEIEVDPMSPFFSDIR